METAAEKRNKAAKLMKSRAKRNSYTQGGMRGYFFGYPQEGGNGYSDCSSACRAAILRAAGVDIGSNTHTQVINRSKAIVIEMTDGHYPDEAKLRVGDCLYFKGNTSHALDVGHVEMYTGPNECYGHGSATGPTKKDLRAYCKSRATKSKRYFMALRFIFDNTDDDDCPILGLGVISDAVGRMQSLLMAQGYDLPDYGADNEFGSETLAALTAFKAANGLQGNGVCDAATWAALTQEPAVAIDNQDAVNPYDEPKKCVGSGAIGSAVKWIQWELIDAGFSCGQRGIDGEFGAKTRAAVMGFQTKVFPETPREWDGIVGERTRAAMRTVRGDVAET